MKPYKFTSLDPRDQSLRSLPVTIEEAQRIVNDVCGRAGRDGVKVVQGGYRHARYGQYSPNTKTITLFRYGGSNLASVLHEVAHHLAGKSGNRYHSKAFFQTCERLWAEWL